MEFGALQLPCTSANTEETLRVLTLVQMNQYVPPDTTDFGFDFSPEARSMPGAPSSILVPSRGQEPLVASCYYLF